MKHSFKPGPGLIISSLALMLFVLPFAGWAQEDKPDEKSAAEEESTAEQKKEATGVDSEITIGADYLSEDSYRFGKYSGLTEEGVELALDFRWEKRPVWDSGDTVRWRLQGWRLGLDSRRIEYSYNDQGSQKFRVDYREIPNYRFDDGQTPYRAQQPDLWNLASGWEVAPGSSNTLGFTALDETLVDLRVDTKRKRMDLAYERKLGASWVMDIDFRHETKEGVRTLGSIFGHAASNPRSVILPAPVDWTTDTLEAMFAYNTARIQAGAGIYASFFSNDESSFTFQNAYGYRNGWAPGIRYPDSYGRAALEPDNSYLQFKAYGGINLARSTRLTADFSYGKMEQDEALLPYTVNPDLNVHTGLPLSSLDAEVNTTMLNLRLTSQLAQRLGLSVNYRYDDRDNKTPRAVYPYIGGDSQDQRPYERGRINLPYSYTRHSADATLTYRMARATRFKAGLDYSDYSRDYQEVRDSDELGWLAGVALRGWSTGSLSLDVRGSSRDVSEYVGNAPLMDSYLPGTVDPDDYENHPLLRKYFLADRDRDEVRIRADLTPGSTINLGVAGSYFEDDYSDSMLGLTGAKVRSVSIDAGWFPRDEISLTAFYTWEKYDSKQAGRSFFDDASAADPANNWSADSEDQVNTWNFALVFSDIGAESGWKGVDFGFEFTFSDTSSDIDVASDAPFWFVAPLPKLKAQMRSLTLWGTAQVGTNSSIRIAAEKAELSTSDWALDGVEPDTLANVLLLGESAANYDLWLISGSWTYHF